MFEVLKRTLWLQWRVAFFDFESVASWFFPPLVFGCSLALLYDGAGRHDLVPHAVAGCITGAILTASVFGTSFGLFFDQLFGVAEIASAATLRVGDHPVSKAIAAAASGIPSGLVAAAASVVIVRPRIGSDQLFRRVVVGGSGAVIVVVGGFAIGLLVASFWGKRGPQFSSLSVLEAALAMVGAVYYPRFLLPSFLDLAPLALPFHYGNEAMASSIAEQAPSWTVLLGLAVSLGLAVIYVASAIFVLHVRLRAT